MLATRPWGAITASIALHGAVLGAVLAGPWGPQPATDMQAVLSVELVPGKPTAEAVSAVNPPPAPLLAPDLAPTAQAPAVGSPPPRTRRRDIKSKAHQAEKRQVVAATKTDDSIEMASASTAMVEPPPSLAEVSAAPAAVVAKQPVSDADTMADQSRAAPSDQAASPGVADQTYLRSLVAWLERHKDYPEQARVKREQGTVLIAFSIDRAGHVLSFAVRKSSGFVDLDLAAKTMVDRANPMPPLPNSFARDRLALTLPVEFALK